VIKMAGLPKNNRLKKPSTGSGGFSLLELVATLAVLSTLTAVTAVGFNGNGGILAQVKYAKIDEAKALLNAAAADCLQKSRINDEDKDEIDDTIISDQRLNPIGFEIDTENGANKCSYFQIKPTDSNESIRYPIGFSVSGGVLSKFATPSSSEQRSIASCERWAGVNCKQDECLKKLVDWKNQIATNKEACELNYTKWLTESNTTPFQFQRWNPNADSNCPTRCPKDGSESYQTPTCTTNGCNREVFGLDGEFVGFTKPDYDRALEEKYGKACSEWVSEKEQAGYTNNITSLSPEKKVPECGEQEFWFFKGEDQGTREKFLETACNAWIDTKSNENPPYTNTPINEPQTTPECGAREFWFIDGVDYKTKAAFDAQLLETASGRCAAEREEARASGFVGKWGPVPGPGVCAEESYICDYKIVDETYYYANCAAVATPEQCKETLTKEDPECTEYELSDYYFRKCGARPEENCRKVGMGKPFRGWNKTAECSEWAQCMNLY